MIGITPSVFLSYPSVYPTAFGAARGTNTTSRSTEETQVTGNQTNRETKEVPSYPPEGQTTNNQIGKEAKDASSKNSPEGQKTGNRTDQDKNAEVVKKFRARDTEVRAHESAHIAAAGGLAQGGPHFTYERGPDGQLYAIGGSVSIDVSPVPGDPSATISKARIIRSAALAPTEPSGQDQAVAAAAAQMAQRAQSEISQQQTGNGTHGNGKSVDKVKVGKTEQCSDDHSSGSNQTKSSTSSPSTSGKLSYGSGEMMISAAGRRLQTALVTVGSTTSNPVLNVYA